MAVKEFTGELDQPTATEFTGDLDLPDVGVAEKVAGHPLTRVALGAASPFLGLAQLGLESVGQGEDITRKLGMLEQAKKRGMEYWYAKGGKPEGAKGVDVAGLAGTILSPPSLAVMKYLPRAEKLGKRMKHGAAIGAGAGATTPVVDDKDFLQAKASQTGFGTVVGGGLPIVAKAGEAAVGFGQDIADLLRAGGPARIVKNYLRKLVGEENLDKVMQALRTVPRYVPGSRPTAAEAVSGLPAGSPIQAHQQIVSRLPGGPSAAFGERLAEQETARLAAQAATDTLTAPMREASLTAANAKGGVATPHLLAEIYNIANQPGLRTSSVVQKTLNDVREKISTAAGTTLRMDANDLYTIRKELGNTITKYSQETQTFDKRLTAGLERDVQQAIDDAIEDAGGIGWKKYLSAYARQAKRLEADVERSLGMYQPKQLTALGTTVKEEELAALPHILTRPMVIGNWVLKLFKHDIQPAIQKELSRVYLDPNALAKALAHKPPMVEPEIWEALLRASQIAGSRTVAQRPMDMKHTAKQAAQSLGATP